MPGIFSKFGKTYEVWFLDDEDNVVVERDITAVNVWDVLCQIESWERPGGIDGINIAPKVLS